MSADGGPEKEIEPEAPRSSDVRSPRPCTRQIQDALTTCVWAWRLLSGDDCWTARVKDVERPYVIKLKSKDTRHESSLDAERFHDFMFASKYSMHKGRVCKLTNCYSIKGNSPSDLRRPTLACISWQTMPACLTLRWESVFPEVRRVLLRACAWLASILYWSTPKLKRLWQLDGM